MHCAGYFLNPHFHYSPNFKVNADIKYGLYTCMQRLVPDAHDRAKIEDQFDNFNKAKGLFGLEAAKISRNRKTPGKYFAKFLCHLKF